MTLAIFDFDGTIYQGETLHLFLRVLAKNPALRRRVRWYFASHAPGYLLYKLGIARQFMMRTAMQGLARVMKGMSGNELQELYHDIYQIGCSSFCPQVMSRLNEHLQRGDRVILLSGAIDGFVALVAARLGVMEWIGSELSVENHLCTGRMCSVLMAEEKVRALQKHLGEEMNLKDAVIYADGLRDLPLLKMAGHPVAAHPEPELARVAKAMGWEIIQ